LGIFRSVERTVYEDTMSRQLVEAQSKRGPGDLQKLVGSLGTWVVE
jgi:hypothetical protein